MDIPDVSGRVCSIDLAALEVPLVGDRVLCGAHHLKQQAERGVIQHHTGSGLTDTLDDRL